MKKVLIFLFLGGALFSIGSETLNIDVETAVDMALKNNLTIRSEELTLTGKKRQKDWAYSVFFPRLSASATLSRMNEAPPDISGLAPAFPFESPPGVKPKVTYTVVPFEEEIDHTWGVSFGFQASFTLTGQLFYAIDQALLEYEAGQISLNGAKKKLSRDVKKAFYNLLFMDEDMKLMEQNIEAANNRFEQANDNYQAGLAPEYTVLSAQVAMENLKPVLEDMKIGYRTSLLAFKQLIGTKRGADIRLSGTIDTQATAPVLEENLENTFAMSVQKRNDIQALRNTIASLENLKKISEADFLPTLTLMLSMDPTFMKDPFDDPWFEDVDDDWMQRGGMFSITLNVPLDPLLPTSQSWYRIESQKEAIRQAEIGLAQAIQGAELEIETIILGVSKSLNSIETLKLNVDLANRAYELAEEAYRAGSRELLEVQNAELELRKAQLDVLRERYRYITGMLDLEYAMNTSLDRGKGK